MSLRVVIVDDEALARRRVRQLVDAEPGIEVVAECGNGPDAPAAIRRERTQLLFMDVQMPEMDGFAVLEQVPQDQLPAVVFTTAFDGHAIRAFDAHAIDYLHKPLQADRFHEAVERVRARLAHQQAQSTIDSLMTFLNGRADREPRPPSETRRLTRLTVNTGEKVVIVRAVDIEAIESAGNYVSVHVGAERHIPRDTITALEAQLDPDRFLRISRSALVNLTRVKELQPMGKGEHVVVMHSGRRLVMTRGVRDVERALRFA